MKTLERILNNAKERIEKLDRIKENGYDLLVKIDNSEDTYDGLTLNEVVEQIKNILNDIEYNQFFEIIVFTDNEESLHNNYSLEITEEECEEILKEKETAVKYFELVEEIGENGIKDIEKEMFELNNEIYFSEYFYDGDDETKKIISNFNNLSAGGSLNEVYDFMIEKMIAYVKDDILG